MGQVTPWILPNIGAGCSYPQHRRHIDDCEATGVNVGLERTFRVDLCQLPLPKSRTAKKIGLAVWLSAFNFLALPVNDCCRRD